MWRVRNNQKGYTLTELIVVMAILAIISMFGVSGFISARKVAYIKYLGKETQTQARSAFIDAVSTKAELGGNCNNQTSKLKMVRITLGISAANTAPIKTVAICEITLPSSPPIVKSDVKDVDTNQTGYSQDIEVKADSGAGIVSSGYLYLIYSSPYGKYYSYILDESSDTDVTNLYNKINVSGTSPVPTWQKNSVTNEYLPKPGTQPWNDSNLISQVVKVYFDSDISGGTGVQQEVDIKQSGQVELE